MNAKKTNFTIGLPKLNSKEERKRNLGYVSYSSNLIDISKHEKIIALVDEENSFLGLPTRRQRK